MKLPFSRLTQGSLKSDWPQIAVLVFLVLLLSSNLIGLVEFTGGELLGIELRTFVIQSGDSGLLLPEIVKSADFLMLFCVAIILALVLPILTPLAASGVVALAALPFLYTGIYMPYRVSAIPMQFSLLVILMLFGMNVLISYFMDTQRKQKLIGVFGKFVPPQIVNELSKHPELLNLDGESKILTIFFCDLKDFTGISENMAPKQLVGLLNEYFTLMTTVLYKHGATIDKYIGDSIMAFWGAPLPQEDHADRAVMAAFEMQHELAKLTAALKARGQPSLTMGIGINTGIVNVGNMGSSYRLAYTVIGDAVNLSARLEHLTRIYSVPVIIGEETARLLKNFAVRELDVVKVKGKQEFSRIYEPLGLKSEMPQTVQDMDKKHAEAMRYYYDGKKNEALALFSDLVQISERPDYYRYMMGKLG